MCILTHASRPMMGPLPSLAYRNLQMCARQSSTSAAASRPACTNHHSRRHESPPSIRVLRLCPTAAPPSVANAHTCPCCRGLCLEPACPAHHTAPFNALQLARRLIDPPAVAHTSNSLDPIHLTRMVNNKLVPMEGRQAHRIVARSRERVRCGAGVHGLKQFDAPKIDARS